MSKHNNIVRILEPKLPLGAALIAGNLLATDKCKIFVGASKQVRLHMVPAVTKWRNYLILMEKSLHKIDIRLYQIKLDYCQTIFTQDMLLVVFILLYGRIFIKKISISFTLLQIYLDLGRAPPISTSHFPTKLTSSSPICSDT